MSDFYQNRWTKGGRLYHLTGDNGKGETAELLLRCYRRQQRLRYQTDRIESIGIGDTVNDMSLLTVVDHPILVQKADGSYDPDIHLRQLIRALGIGPAGWNTSVLTLLDQSTSND